MRVVHATTLHPADDVRILLKECRTLAGHGYEVTLAAPVPEPYVDGDVRVVPIGVTSVRTGVAGLAARLARALRALRREPADAYHIHDPELIVAGVALKAGGARVVYDAHEDLPEQIRSLSESGGLGVRAVAGGWAVADGIAARLFDGIVAATPAIAAKFPARKTALVRNVPLAEDAATFGSGVPYAERPTEVAYIGGLSRARGIPQLVRAIAEVDIPDAVLVLAGPLHPHEPDLLAELEALPGWGRVRYEGELPRARLADVLGRVRAGLVVFQPVPSHVVALPNKLFEYMAAGIPVIAASFPLWRSIVEPAGAGLLVDPTSPAAIAAAVTSVLRDPEAAAAMGERGRAASEQDYNWDAEAGRLLDLYRRIGITPRS